MGRPETPLIPTHAAEKRADNRWTIGEAWSWVLSLLALVVFALVLIGQEHPFNSHRRIKSAQGPHFGQPFVSPTETYHPDHYPSRLVGGVPGFTVWDNVWFRDDTFYAFANEWREPKDVDKVVSGGSGFRVITPSETTEEIDIASTRRRLEGVTVFVNDRLGSSPSPYYHLFAGSLLGAAVTLSSIQSGASTAPGWDRLVIPHDQFWADEGGMSELIGTAIFNDTSRLIFQGEWEVLTKTRWNQKGSILMDRVIIVDHHAAVNHHQGAHDAHTAAVATLDLPHPPTFFDGFRPKLYSSLDISHPTERMKPGKAVGIIPKVVYLDAQASAQGLTDEHHEGLLQVLMSIASEGLASTVHLWVDLMANSNLLEMISNADILVGVHGAEMTHEMWMPSGAKIIEIFPSGSYSPEIAVLSEAMGHEHLVVRGGKVSNKNWRTMPLSREGLSGIEPVQVNLKSVEKLLRKSVREMTNH